MIDAVFPHCLEGAVGGVAPRVLGVVGGKLHRPVVRGLEQEFRPAAEIVEIHEIGTALGVGNPTIAHVSEDGNPGCRVIAGRHVSRRGSKQEPIGSDACLDRCGVDAEFRRGGTDIDRASNGVSPVKCTLRPVQDLDLLDTRHARVETVVVADIDVVDIDADARIGAESGCRDTADRNCGCVIASALAGKAGVRRGRKRIAEPLDDPLLDLLLRINLQADGNVLGLLLAPLRSDRYDFEDRRILAGDFLAKGLQSQ